MYEYISDNVNYYKQLFRYVKLIECYCACYKSTKDFKRSAIEFPIRE